MDRRGFLVTTAVTLLAGCTTSGDTTPTPDAQDSPPTSAMATAEGLPPISITPESLTPAEPDARVNIRWRARVQHRIAPTGEDRFTIAEDGHKWVVVQCEFNCEKGAAKVRPIQFELQAGGQANQIVLFRDGEYALTETTLEAGATHSRFIAFHPPAEARLGTLQILQERTEQTLAASWSPAPELEFTAAQ